MVAPNFYNTVDQGIYNQGYSFIPQERFRLADPNLGGSTTTAPVTGGINTVPINMGGGGGGGDFPGEEGGTTADDLGGDEGGEEGGADLGGEEIDFEEPGEEPDA